MKRVSVALLLLLAVSCVPSKRREVGSPSELGSGEVLLIGRIKLTPPIDKDDQALPGMVEDWRSHVMLILGEAATPLRRPFGTSGYKGRIQAPPDREFSVAVPSGVLFIRGAVVPLKLDEPPTDEALLPGGFRIDLRPDDTAVYVGTIHYQRNEFWQVTLVEVEDDYERVKADCAKKWGASAALRKALVSVPPRQAKDR